MTCVAQQPQLLLEADQRDHDLDLRRLAALGLHRAGGADDRRDLHAVDVGPLDAQAAAARAEHRVDLVQLLHLGQLLLGLGVGRAGRAGHGDALGQLDQAGQELVQRRVEQADRDRQAGHGPEDPLEVALLEGAQRRQRLDPRLVVAGEDHPLHDRQPVLALEHVLGAAEADALGAELARPDGVLGRVGVRAHAHGAGAVGPLDDAQQVGVVRVRRQQRRVARVDQAAGAVDGDAVPLGEGPLADRDRPVLGEADRADAADGRLAHPDGHDGRVAGLAAAGGQDALGLDHAVEVVRRGLVAHQDHVLAGLAPALGLVGREDDRPGCGAGRGVDPGRQRRRRGGLVELGQQQLAGSGPGRPGP